VSKWEKVYLEDVCDILDSLRVPITAKDRKPGGYPYYGANGLQDFVEGYIYDDELVLLAEDGGSFGSKEKPIAYRVSGKCWVNNHAHVLKPKSLLDVDYLCYSIMFYDVTPIITGTTRAKLTQAAMRKMIIPLPPYEVQKRISYELDSVSELLALRKQQLEELDQLINSVFYEMFGDPVENEKGWELKSIGDIADVKIGPFGSLLHVKDYIKGGHCLVNPSHIVNEIIVPDEKLSVNKEKFLELSSYRLEINDLVIGRRGEIGRCAVVKEEGLLCGTGSMFVRIRNNTLIPFVLQKIISGKSMRTLLEHLSVGVTMKNLNAGTITSLQIPMLPISLQKQFSEIATLIEAKKFLVQQSIDETQRLFDSLMSKYFND
jgi:type I restriction enzyme S subunit